jgi:hypothetical protein
MAKSKSSPATESEESQEATTTTPVVMTGRAIGTGFDPTTGSWVAAVLEFNPATGDARVSSTVSTGSSKMDAVEKFKILAVEEGVVV